MYILNTCVVFRNLKKKKLICCILDQSFRLHLILFGPVMRSVSSVRRTLVLNIRTVRVLVGKSWVSVGGNWNVSFIYFITHYAAPQLWVNVSYFLCDSSYSAADDVLARAPMRRWSRRGGINTALVMSLFTKERGIYAARHSYRCSVWWVDHRRVRR